MPGLKPRPTAVARRFILKSAGSMTTPIESRTAAHAASSFDTAAKLAASLDAEIGRIIIGQARTRREVLTCLLAGGHCLLRGVPGLAKTLLIKTLAEAT